MNGRNRSSSRSMWTGTTDGTIDEQSPEQVVPAERNRGKNNFSLFLCDVKPLARRVVQKKAIAEDEEIKTPFAIIKKRSANCI